MENNLTEFHRLKDEGVLSSSLEGHTYIDFYGVEMVKFHLDCDNEDTLLNEFD